MNSFDPKLWKNVLCNYTKDYALLDKWINQLDKLEPERILRITKKHVCITKYAPQALTLGFSPQVLIGALSLSRPIIVFTSPEVIKGSGPARFSKKALEVFKDYLKIYTTPFAPSKELSPVDVIREAMKVFDKARVEEDIEILDLSGGTQLIPLAAIKAGFKKFTYSYPDGERLIFYGFEL